MKSIAEPKYSFGVKYRLYYILFPNHFLKKKKFFIITLLDRKFP